MDLKNDLATLMNLRKNLIDYIYVKLRIEDWHGVADAAMDLREVDAKLEVLRERREEDEDLKDRMERE